MTENRSIGIVLDIEGLEDRRAVRSALVGMIQKLESNTDDKVFVYNGVSTQVPRHLGDSVAAIGNYVEPKGFNPETAIKGALRAISAGQEDNRRSLLYFVDHNSPFFCDRIRRVALFNDTNGVNADIHVFAMEEARTDDLNVACEGLNLWFVEDGERIESEQLMEAIDGT